VTIEPGARLLNYRLVERLGEGGMGVVWRAVDETLSREVAVKILPDVFAGDPDRLSRFEREAKVLASLNHPGIATIHGLHEAGRIRFLVTELVPGTDLAKRSPKGDRFVVIEPAGAPLDLGNILVVENWAQQFRAEH
jgi:serine/threonine protein kinase